MAKRSNIKEVTQVEKAINKKSASGGKKPKKPTSAKKKSTNVKKKSTKPKMTNAQAKQAMTGVTVSDILDISLKDFMRLTTPELRAMTSRLASAANKRLKTMESKGVTSPAYIGAMKSGGKFSVKGKNLNQLRSEFARAKKFLQAETSTQKGYKKVQNKTIETLQTKNVELTQDEFDTFWKAYNRLKELDPAVAGQEFRYTVYKEMTADIQENEDISVDDLVDQIQEKLDQIYREQEEINNEFDGVSSFFRNQE